MTAKAALCKALLAGETLSIRSCFDMVGVINIWVVIKNNYFWCANRFLS